MSCKKKKFRENVIITTKLPKYIFEKKKKLTTNSESIKYIFQKKTLDYHSGFTTRVVNRYDISYVFEIYKSVEIDSFANLEFRQFLG